MKDKDWEIVYELSKTQNISKVASKLFMTQPAMTKRLKSIEDELQIKLVTRTTKGVTFSEEGKVVAKYAEQYLHLFNDMVTELQFLEEEKSGRIYIGASYSFNRYYLPELVYNYTKINPSVKFEIINEPSNILYQKVIDGVLDMAFLCGDYDGPMNKTFVGSTKGYIVTKNPIELNQLQEMPQILYRTNDKSKELINKWWYEYFDKPPIRGMNAGYIDFSWPLINSDLGYTICFLSESFQNALNLTLTPAIYKDGTQMSRNMWCIYRKKEKISKACEEFVDFVNETYMEIY